jgi:hypothetical protein
MHIRQSDIEIAIEAYGVGAYHSGDEPLASEESHEDEGRLTADDAMPF